MAPFHDNSVPQANDNFGFEFRSVMMSVAVWLASSVLGRVLIKAQIGGPLSGADRKAFAHFETYRFCPFADIPDPGVVTFGLVDAVEISHVRIGSGGNANFTARLVFVFFLAMWSPGLLIALTADRIDVDFRHRPLFSRQRMLR